jgi:selT/selW/selH-like putative selenoprotein
MILQSRALETLEVRGAEYPPDPDKVMYAQFVFYVQLGLFAFVFFGESLLAAAQIPSVPILGMVKDNKFASFMFIFLVGNMVQANLLSTGAFEIYKGKELIWSGLEEHRLPNMQDLVTAFGKVGVEFMQTHRDENP